MDGCIFWMGQGVFNGPPGTLKDSMDIIAVQETPAAAFSPQEAAPELQLKIKASSLYVHLCHATDTWR